MPDAAFFASRAAVLRFCQLAATVGALYDHVLTLPDEVRFVWRKRWTPLKALFLFNRYLGAAMLLLNAVVFLRNDVSAEFCGTYIRVQAVTTCVLIWAVQAIMQYRLYAIYERSLRLVHALGALWAAEAIAMVVILGLSHRVGGTTTLHPSLGLRMCTPTRVPDFLYAFWIPVMAFEAVMFALALKKGFSHVVQFAKYGNWWCPKMITGVLVRDSILYFFINCAVYLATLVLWLTLGPQWLELPEGFALGITCVMGARMILNLREAYHDAPSAALFTTGVAWEPPAGEEPDPMWPGKGGAQPGAHPGRPAARIAPCAPKRDNRRTAAGRVGGGAPPRARGKRGQEDSGMEFAVPARRRATDTLDELADEESALGGGGDGGAWAGRLDAAFYDRPDSMRTFAPPLVCAPGGGVRGAAPELDELSPRTVVGEGAEERARDAEARRKRGGGTGTGSVGSVSGASLGVGAARGLSFGSVVEEPRGVEGGGEGEGTLGAAWGSGSGETLGVARRQGSTAS